MLPREVARNFYAYACQSKQYDPFDRMLLSQAALEGHTLVTSDAAFRELTIKLLW
jgi:PIN domain nuclease of toxin-antitoxin system